MSNELDLIPDEKRLHDALPRDSSPQSNHTVRAALGWNEERYWLAREGLLAKGYAKKGKGRGGTLRLVSGDKHDMLAAIPADGSPIGNQSLQAILDWPLDTYWRVRNQLLDEGLIERGRGRGGSVRRVDEAEPGETLAEETAAIREYECERDLYEPLASVLREFWCKDMQFDRFLVEITADQGRRWTGGRWTRPDIAIVSERAFALSNQTAFDVTTFEVKRKGAWDITAIYEAASQNRAATRSYAMLQLDEDGDERSNDLLERCAREAERVGVGLITFSDPSTPGWTELVRAHRWKPDPDDLEDFLRRQLSDARREELMSWRA